MRREAALLDDGSVQSPEAQIRAILSENTFRWAVDQLPPGQSIDDVTFADLISVSRDDVYEYVLVHGFLGSVADAPVSPDMSERLYIESSSDGQWCIFYLERGQRNFEVLRPSHEAARRWVVDHLYDSARASLNHRWWHAHPDERPPSISAMP